MKDKNKKTNEENVDVKDIPKDSPLKEAPDDASDNASSDAVDEKGEHYEVSSEFLKNEDHIEFIGGLLGVVFESEEEALDALGRISINGRRLTNIDDLEEAVRLIRQAIAQGGPECIEVEIDGTFRSLRFPDDDYEAVRSYTETTPKPKKDKKIDKSLLETLFGTEKPKEEEAAAEPEAKAEDEKEVKKEKKEREREVVLEYPENDRTEDVYTFTRPEEFNLKFDTYSDDFLNNNVSGIVVLSRLSGMPLKEKGESRENLERAADRLYVNGMPAIMFYGLGKKEKLTEEDYNTLGTSIANTLKETFMDNKRGNYVMFRGEREDTFTAFTMSSDSALSTEPKKVELLTGAKRFIASKEKIAQNEAEYMDYINNKLPSYEEHLRLEALSRDAANSAATVIPLDKIRKTSIEELNRAKGIVTQPYTPTAPVKHLEKSEDQMTNEPQLMGLGSKSKSKRNNRPDGDNK